MILTYPRDISFNFVQSNQHISCQRYRVSKHTFRGVVSLRGLKKRPITAFYKTYFSEQHNKSFRPGNCLTIYSTDTHFHASITVFENIVRKEEIAHNRPFLFYPQCFQINQVTVSPFVHIFDIIISLFGIELEKT